MIDLSFHLHHLPPRFRIETPGRSVEGVASEVRWRVNMAHVRQSRRNPRRGLQVEALKPFQVVPSSLGRALALPE